MFHKHFQRCDSNLIEGVNLGFGEIISFIGNHMFSYSERVLIFNFFEAWIN